jgi:hypothetical protein
MCFTLYAGTAEPLPRKAWDKVDRGLSLAPLAGGDSTVASHFSLEVVQRIVDDPGLKATERMNREALVLLLRDSGERTIELYGIWDDEFEKPVMSGSRFPLPGF